MQKITPFLWFNDQAEEAVRFYKGIFKRTKVLKTARYGEGGAKASGQKMGTVMTIEFELEGQRFLALNGGPSFKFTEAISFVVNCKTQAEIDYFWKKLSAGGYESQCCWLKDKFGVSWQIFPVILMDLLTGKDDAKANRVMSALMTMRKPDLAALKKAAVPVPGKSRSKK
ncbi:MAG TPA: VOC family protein [Verrucomicrobiae bacterium]|jgi:predicted 3-demethylubiquinone-9 3-methyltransferase (glyoxalase superfamily)